MSPIKIEIILHYYHAVDDYRGGDFSAPVVSEALNDFISVGILTQLDDPAPEYAITEKGRAYVEALMGVPFPVNVWMSPAEKEAYVRPTSLCPYERED